MSTGSLAPDVVVSIRHERAGGASLNDLAIQFGLSNKYISSICLGRVYRRVGGPIVRGKTGPKGLKPTQIVALRTERAMGRSLKSLADQYSITAQHAGQVCRGDVFSGVEGIHSTWQIYRNQHQGLPASAIRSIRRQFYKGEATQSHLARLFGLAPATVCQIVNGHLYEYAGGPTSKPVVWSSRACVRCSILLPERIKGKLCHFCLQEFRGMNHENHHNQ